MSKVTSASSYSEKEILLLAQLLYINNLSDGSHIDSASDQLITTILSEFKNHVTMKLDKKVVKLNTRNQLKELYSHLLTQYKVNNTEELANATYYGRIEELNQQIATYKQEFYDTLHE